MSKLYQFTNLPLIFTILNVFFFSFYTKIINTVYIFTLKDDASFWKLKNSEKKSNYFFLIHTAQPDLLTSEPIIIFSSFTAKFCPMQFLFTKQKHKIKTKSKITYHESDYFYSVMKTILNTFSN